MPQVDPRDTAPQGDPDTVVLLPTGGALVGLYIRGLKDKVMLGIREDCEGQPVSCAVTNEIVIDTSTKRMDMNLLSNPRRPDTDDGGD